MYYLGWTFFNAVLHLDALYSTENTQTFKASRMGYSVKASLWCDS